MDDREVIAIIEGHRRSSLGGDEGQLSIERAAALDHYHGRPYGNEEEGRSSIVSRDLSETIDWIMPAVLEPFIIGDVLEFSPRGEEDEPLAKQETAYTNHVILNKNESFIIFHDWFKDALLLKNGYVKVTWEEREEIEEEEYHGLTDDQVTMLLMEAGEGVEIIEHEETTAVIDGVPTATHKLNLRAKSTEGKLCIEAVPAEEMRVSKRCRGPLSKSPFTEHVTIKTRSDLVEMGMDKDFVRDLPTYAGQRFGTESYARDSISNETEHMNGSSDRSMDEIEYCEAYIRIDYDGDGIAELRKIVTVGGKLPKGDDWNEQIDSVPVISISPKRVPHRHVGESIDDDLSDLQRMKTELMRQLFDNVDATTHQQWLINERVNLDDMFQTLPGGFKRVSGEGSVMDAIAAVPVTPIASMLLPVIDYVDGVKGNRSGVTPMSTGIDPDVLKNSTRGAYMENMSRASQKVQMIIRMFAETGVKELVLRVHELLIKHQDKEDIIRLTGKYVPINPKEWKRRTDLTVKVGIGAGTNDERSQKLLMLSAMQDKAAQAGLVGAKQAFNMFTEQAQTLGQDNPEKFVMNPDSPEYKQIEQERKQQGQTDPLVAAEKVKAEAKLQSDQAQFQLRGQIAQMQAQHKQQLDMMQMQMDSIKEGADRRSRETIEAAKLEVQTMLAGLKLDIGRPGIGAGLQDE